MLPSDVMEASAPPRRGFVAKLSRRNRLATSPEVLAGIKILTMEVVEALSKFREFLQSKDIDGGSLKSERLVLSMSEIRQFSRDLSHTILNDPMVLIPHLEEDIGVVGIKHLGFFGAFGANALTPRTVRSGFISKMIVLEGIVTGVSLMRPKMYRSVHFCEARNLFYKKEYRDSTMITRLPPTNTVYPVRDGDRNPLSPEFGQSDYVDFQTVTLQEMPEHSPPGLLPQSIDVILSSDLVDSAKPGDRVRITGIYKSFCFPGSNFPSRFQTVFIANCVKPVREQQAGGDHDMSKLTILATSDRKYKAIAPTIYGHDDIKRAILLMTVGGNEQIMKNGSKIRRDINI